jgi:hypothetical protein
MDLPTRMTGGSEDTVSGANNRSTALDKHNPNTWDVAAIFKSQFNTHLSKQNTDRHFQSKSILALQSQ